LLVRMGTERTCVLVTVSETYGAAQIRRTILRGKHHAGYPTCEPLAQNCQPTRTIIMTK